MSSKRRAKITKQLLEEEYVDIDVKNKCLATALYNITTTHPFMGAILQCLNMMYTHFIPTAGVTFNAEAKRWDLYINPKFFCKTMDLVLDRNGKSKGHKARKAILLHELFHVTNKHPMRVPFIKISAQKRQLMNVAADMAINQYISDLPQGCPQCPPAFSGQECENENCPGKTVNIKDFYDEDEKGNKTPWEPQQTMEYYYEKLLQKLKENMGKGRGCKKCGGTGTVLKEGAGAGSNDGGEEPCPDCAGMPNTHDEHMWDAAGDERDMLDATEDLVKRAMIKSRMSYDDLDNSIKELLQDIKTRKAELDYRGEILAAIKKSASGHERKHTWSRKSRRFGTKAPGTKVGDLPKLDFHIDTSGSISVEEGNEFLNIVDNFLRTGSRKCRLNLFHTTNYFSEEYKLGQRLKREDWCSGGTCLEATMRDIATRRPDLAIIVTDGYYGDIDITGWLPPGVHFPQCLFIISREGQEDHPLKRFGRTIKIPSGARL